LEQPIALNVITVPGESEKKKVNSLGGGKEVLYLILKKGVTVWQFSGVFRPSTPTTCHTSPPSSSTYCLHSQS